MRRDSQVHNAAIWSYTGNWDTERVSQQEQGTLFTGTNRVDLSCTHPDFRLQTLFASLEPNQS